jgi:hypothetical protein
LGLVYSAAGVGQPFFIVVVDQPARTPQQIVGVITPSRDPPNIGILTWQRNSDGEAYSLTMQLKLKPTPSLGISKRPPVPMIMVSSSLASSGAAPCSTKTKRCRANSG